jgi:uncharacterized protein (TIGR02246 family)
MRADTPEQAIEGVAAALNGRDVDGALSLYERDAAFCPAPGETVTGKAAIAAALEGFVALEPTLTGEIEKVVRAGDTALVTNSWTLVGAGPDGPVELTGRSADVARRQDDGSWLVAIDDPWGGA